MASNNIATIFNGTCVPIQLPCRIGGRFVDPCDCKFYYLCRDPASIIRQPCAPGTAYDHTGSTSVCNRFQDVIYGGICDQNNPWVRCTDDYPAADLNKLRQWCTGSGYFTAAPPPKKDDHGADGGAIAAIIISLLLIIAVVVLVVIYVRRKGNPVKHIKQTRFWREVIRREGREYNDSNCNSQQSSPRYAGNPAPAPDDEETYTEIDDAAMYNGDAKGRRRSSARKSVSIANDAYDREEEGAVGGAYDNPALDAQDTPPSDTEDHPAPPAYSPLDDSGEAHAPYTPLSEHKGARQLNEMDRDGDSSSQPPVGDDGYLMATPRRQSGAAAAAAADDRTYYELEKEETSLDISFHA